MQCRKCGNIIADGEMRCRLCQEPVRMVPDYNVQDEILLQQLSNVLEQTSVTGNLKESNERVNAREAGARRRKVEYKRRQRKRQRNMLLVAMATIACLCIFFVYLMYTNSYTGLVKSGSKYDVNGDYKKAIENYDKAIAKRPDRIIAYKLLSEIYSKQSEYGEAEELLKKAVDTNQSNYEFYVMIINFYMEHLDFDKVMPLITEYDNALLMDELNIYIVDGPEFSLEEGVFDDVREVSLTSNGGKILYTTENIEEEVIYSDYDNPVQISSGVTVVTAIVENEIGITSVPISKKYQVELPVEGAPIVSPSTGQYSTPMEIIVQVPIGYQAYYTTDGSVPDENSKIYEGTLNMSEGNTVLSVLLINGDGKKSDVTKRNYELVLD